MRETKGKRVKDGKEKNRKRDKGEMETERKSVRLMGEVRETERKRKEMERK